MMKLSLSDGMAGSATPWTGLTTTSKPPLLPTSTSADRMAETSMSAGRQTIMISVK